MASHQSNNTASALPSEPPISQLSLIVSALVLVFAGPSFVLAAVGPFHPAGLGIPIICMGLLLWVLAGSSTIRNKLGTRLLRRAVIYVIVIRFISLLFVIGLIGDLFMGLMAVVWTEEVFCSQYLGFDEAVMQPSSGSAFVPTFVATCIQGTFLFVEFLFLLPFAILIARHKIEQETKTSDTCRQCGYDLRATPNRCPECGTEPLPLQQAYLAANPQDDEA